jgi:hypothetical protein
VSSASVPHSPSARSPTREDEHPGASQLIPEVSGRVTYHEPAVIPATSARMSFRRSAIWRSSSIDSSKVRPGAESYGWSRLTSLANVLSSPLLFCSW